MPVARRRMRDRVGRLPSCHGAVQVAVHAPWPVLAGAAIVVALTLATLVVGSSRTGCSIPDASATYLLAVVAIAVAFGIPAAAVTAVGAFLALRLPVRRSRRWRSSSPIPRSGSTWCCCWCSASWSGSSPGCSGRGRRRRSSASARPWRSTASAGSWRPQRRPAPRCRRSCRSCSRRSAPRVPGSGSGREWRGNAWWPTRGSSGRPVVPTSYELLQRRAGEETPRVGPDPRPAAGLGGGARSGRSCASGCRSRSRDAAAGLAVAAPAPERRIAGSRRHAGPRRRGRPGRPGPRARSPRGGGHERRDRPAERGGEDGAPRLGLARPADARWRRSARPPAA